MRDISIELYKKFYCRWHLEDLRFKEKLKLDDKYIKSVQKTFRSKKDPKTFKDSYDLLVSMYRNVCRGIVSTKKCREGKNTYQRYTVDKDIIKKTFDLVCFRNKKLTGYTCDAYDYELTDNPVKKMF